MPKYIPRQRKHKLRQRDNQSAATPVDTNATEIVPVSKAEKEERRQKLKEELRGQQPKMSSKKRKRLEKYIVRDFRPAVAMTFAN
jgi:ATP-dependent RNA helicase DHX37/DHR1